MAWDEWEQLKAAAAAEAGSARMRLDQLAPEPSGGAGSGRLRSQKRAWTRAGQEVKHLQEDAGKGMACLKSGQAGLTATAGCQSAVAQKELYTSWAEYLQKLRRRCGELGGLLEQAGRDLSMTDAALVERMDRITIRYADTEAVGGQAAAR